MKRAVIWLNSAHQDLAEITAYIAQHNTMAARKISLTLREAGNNLGKLATGHSGRVENTYEVGISRYPYTIVYSFDRSSQESEVIKILRIIHTARNWPENEWLD